MKRKGQTCQPSPAENEYFSITVVVCNRGRSGVIIETGGGDLKSQPKWVQRLLDKLAEEVVPMALKDKED